MSAPLSVAQLLRHFRTRAGLTQEALAEAAGLSAQAISALENGRRSHPRAVTIDLLTAALDLSPSELEQLQDAARPRSGVPAHTRVPPPLTDFTGRSRQLAELEELLRTPYSAAPGIVISAIGGMGGVGKTTLAVKAASLVTAEYPDGQLYLNLRGGTGNPLGASEAIEVLLKALGIPSDGTSDPEVSAKRYRTALAGRRMLIVLDDAAGAAQVLPLIPGTAGSAVLITSRQRLSELPGMRRIDLDVLAEREAVQLLAEIVGPDVITQNPEDALQVVRRCGLLPLAIRIAGGQCAKSARGLEELAAQLADDAGRLNALTGPGRLVNKSIALSLSALSTGQRVDVAAADAFPVLSLFDGDWFPLRAAAKVLGRSMQDTEDLLERLVDLHLLETPAPHRYQLHDLVRDIGRDLARTALTEPELTEIFHRELNCYLAVLWRYAELIEGLVDLYGTWSGTSWSADAEDLSDRPAILEWLAAELPNLVRLIGAAAGGDAAERLTAVQLALGVTRVARELNRYAEAYEALSSVVTLQVDLDIRLDQGRLYQMSLVSGMCGLFAEAKSWSDLDLPLARAIGEPTQLSASLIDRSYCLNQLGRPAESLACAEEALRLVEETGARTHEPGANVAVGTVAGHLGDLTRQRTAFGRAFELLSQLTPRSDAYGRKLIGTSFRESGQYEASLDALKGALEQSRTAKTEVLEASILTELGSTWLAIDEHDRACAALTEAVALAARYPKEHQEPLARQLLGRALAGLGMVAEARAEWEKAIVLYDRMADPRAGEVRGLLRG